MTGDKAHPLRVPMSRQDKQRLVVRAEGEEVSLSALLRDVISEAAAVGKGREVFPHGLDDDPASIRLDQATADAWRAASAAVRLEPTVWLRLLVTDAGRLLLKQLVAAQKRLGRTK
jgi:DNA-directed RNA polymerase subunit L